MILASSTADQPKPGSGMPPGDMEALKTAQLTDFELYNVRDDLGEQRDRAAEEPERLRELSTLLVHKYREAQAEGPSWPAWQPPRKKAER
jgi:arylsulfatase A